MCAGHVKAIRNHAMRLKQFVKVDPTEDKAPAEAGTGHEELEPALVRRGNEGDVEGAGSWPSACVAAGLFAATPPFEGLRMLLIDATTVGPEDEGRCKSLMINDVSAPLSTCPKKKEQAKTRSDPSCLQRGDGQEVRIYGELWVPREQEPPDEEHQNTGARR